MSTPQLTTASAVIDALGGTTVVARLADRSPQAVTNWRAADRLPAETFLVLQAALKASKKEAPASLWGIREPAPAGPTERAAS